MSVIGIDLGGTKIASAIFAKDGSIVHKQIAQLENRHSSGVSDLIRDHIFQMMSLIRDSGETIQGIGISVPGIYFENSGEVWAPNIPGWDRYPLLHELISISEINNIRVKIDSDRACYILGEVWQGKAKGCKDAIFLAIGTGIGAGILINGSILRGQQDIAGAVGWLGLNRPFRTEYKSCGNFEYFASGNGIARTAQELLAKDKKYSGVLRNKKAENISSYDIFEAYDVGDPLAEKVLERCIEYWGMAVANLVSTFNPEKIILGGGVFGPAAIFLNRIQTEAEKWAQPISFKNVRIEVTALGGDAGLIGAGYLPLYSHLNG